MTDDIAAVAREAASAGTEVLAVTPRFGPASVESILEAHIAAVGIIDAAAQHATGCDAVVLGGFGELGREALQELLEVPVVDITDAAAHVACFLGRTFGVVTTLERSVPSIEDRLTLAGLRDRCAGVRATEIPVLDLTADPAATVKAVCATAELSVREDGAEVVCLGCAGMGGLALEVSRRVGVPVVDGVPAAIRLAETLHALGLRTSKVGFYAPSPPKAFLGWPLPVQMGPPGQPSGR
jgi:allantoin racemase